MNLLTAQNLSMLDPISAHSLALCRSQCIAHSIFVEYISALLLQERQFQPPFGCQSSSYCCYKRTWLIGRASAYGCTASPNIACTAMRCFPRLLSSLQASSNAFTSAFSPSRASPAPAIQAFLHCSQCCNFRLLCIKNLGVLTSKHW